MTQNTIHPVHKPVPLGQVLADRSYPFAVATSPIKDYIKARLGRGSTDAGLLQALNRTLQTARHCYPRQNDVIWATVQRAGHNWVSLVYTLVLESLHHQREIDIADIAQARTGYYRHIPIRYDLGDHETRFQAHLPIPRLMHTHNPFYPWMAPRKILLQVRDPRDVLISKYVHGDFYPQMSLAAYLQTETVGQLMTFYNTWGQALADGQLRQVYCLRYEQMKADPLCEMQRVLAFLNIEGVSPAMVESALAKTAPAQLARLERKGQSLGDDKLLYNIKSTAADSLTAADEAALTAFLRQHLRHTFDYL
jgi:hypothetical protein